MIDLIEAISFLHTNALLIHLGISPENVYLSLDGKLKLGGFLFTPSPISSN